MSEITLFIFASIGLTHIIVDGKIFEPLRNFVKKYCPQKFYDLITCPQCLGLYMGFICGWLCFTQIDLYQIAACGFASSFLASFAGIVMNYLEAQSVMEIEES